MYTISKRIEVAGSHRLDLSYDSPCQNIHGHNWICTIEVQGKELDRNGMLIDFKHIKNVVNKLDHKHINDIVAPLNPTAENIARWIREEVNKTIPQTINSPYVSKVTVQESEGNIACYIP